MHKSSQVCRALVLGAAVAVAADVVAGAGVAAAVGLVVVAADTSPKVNSRFLAAPVCAMSTCNCLQLRALLPRCGVAGLTCTEEGSPCHHLGRMGPTHAMSEPREKRRPRMR